MLSICLTLPLALVYFLVTGAPFLSVVFGTFLATLAMECLYNALERDKRKIVIAIFIGKFALTIYQALMKNLPMGGVDWWNYHNTAQRLLEHHDDFFSFLFSKSELFAKSVASIYYLFGVHTMQINAYILASSFVAALFIYKTTLLLTEQNRRIAFITTLVFLLWPIDIIYSVTYLREMPIQMFVAIGFYYFVCFQKTRKASQLILACFSIMLASMMHSGVIGVLLVFLCCSKMTERDSFSSFFTIKNLCVACILIGLICVSPLWGYITEKLGNLENVDDIVERARQFDIEADTRYITEMPITFGDMILQAPMRTALFAVVPLPWMIHGFDTFLSLILDALPQLFFLYAIYKMYKMTKNDRRNHFWICILIGCMLSTYVVCGFGTTAYGNAIRHRAKIFPIVCVFVVGVYSFQKQKQQHT